MLFAGKKKQKFSATKSLPPDVKSLINKIYRANFVALGWYQCLDGGFQQPNPTRYGWAYDDIELKPTWFEGEVLPNEEEIMKQTLEETVEFINPKNDNKLETNSSDEDYNISEHEESDIEIE